MERWYLSICQRNRFEDVNCIEAAQGNVLWLTAFCKHGDEILVLYKSREFLD